MMNNILSNPMTVIMLGAFLGLIALVLIYFAAWIVEKWDKRKKIR